MRDVSDGTPAPPRGTEPAARGGAVRAEELVAASLRHAEREAWSAALAAAREAARLGPVDARRLAPCLAFCLADGFLQDGVDILEEIERHQRGADPALVNTLGVFYFLLGKPAKAQSLFEVAVEKNLASPLFLSNLGSLHWKAGRLRQAAECWNKALAADVEYQRADYLLQYLQAAHAKEDETAGAFSSPREGKLILPFLPSIPPALPVYTVLIRPAPSAGRIDAQFPAAPGDRLFVFAKGREALIASWDPNGLYLDTAVVEEIVAGRRTVRFSVGNRTLRLQRRRLIRILGFDGTAGQVRTDPAQPYAHVDILTLSAGGFSFRAPWFLSRHQQMAVSLTLDDETLPLAARIVWARPVARRFVYGAEFLVPEKQKDKIARFIHQRQISLRKIEHPQP